MWEMGNYFSKSKRGLTMKILITNNDENIGIIKDFSDLTEDKTGLMGHGEYKARNYFNLFRRWDR